MYAIILTRLDLFERISKIKKLFYNNNCSKKIMDTNTKNVSKMQCNVHRDYNTKMKSVKLQKQETVWESKCVMIETVFMTIIT